MFNSINLCTAPKGTAINLIKPDIRTNRTCLPVHVSGVGLLYTTRTMNWFKTKDGQRYFNLDIAHMIHKDQKPNGEAVVHVYFRDEDPMDLSDPSDIRDLLTLLETQRNRAMWRTSE